MLCCDKISNVNETENNSGNSGELTEKYPTPLTLSVILRPAITAIEGLSTKAEAQALVEGRQAQTDTVFRPYPSYNGCTTGCNVCTHFGPAVMNRPGGRPGREALQVRHPLIDRGVQCTEL